MAPMNYFDFNMSNSTNTVAHFWRKTIVCLCEWGHTIYVRQLAVPSSTLLISAKFPSNLQMCFICWIRFWQIGQHVHTFNANCEFESYSWRGVLDTTLCDKVCRWGIPVSSINKTHCHDITVIILKMALNIKTLSLSRSVAFCLPLLVLSVLLRIAASDYPFGILEFFLKNTCIETPGRSWLHTHTLCVPSYRKWIWKLIKFQNIEKWENEIRKESMKSDI